MNDFKAKLKSILKELKLAEKAKAGKLTQGDWDQIAEAYKAKYSSDYYEDQEKAEAEERQGLLHQSALNLLNDDDDTEGSSASSEKDPPQETAEMKKAREDKVAAEKLAKEKEEENKTLTAKVKTLEAKPEGDNPETVVIKEGQMGMATTDKHLFGVDNEFFSMDHRWNQIANNPRFATLNQVDEKRDGEKFQKAVENYSGSLASRWQALHESGEISALIKGAALDVGHSDLADAGLGKQFVVRRQDELLARIMKVPTVYDIFPRRYGVQDREMITNAFFGEFSQAYQAGEVWKGTVDLQPEVGHVDDAMYKTLFNSMEWIERQYLGYLNSEGSDVVKWSMIEWMVLKIATVLVNEQSKRRIMGHYIKPGTGTPGNALFASTGVVHTLIRYYHELKLLPLDNAAYNTYTNTSTTMVDAVDLFLAATLAARGSLDGYAIHLNKNHKNWYKASVRAKYGAHFDFSGPKEDLVVDWDIPIVWVPNMKQSKMMMLQQPGNIQCLEYLPGEMLGIAFDRDMESVKSWSRWKEGVSAAFAGKKFTTLALLTANAYDLQEIFINKPFTSLAADATTADAAVNNLFKTIVNTGATVLTTISNAKDGEVYVLENGSATNDTTIAKSGDFSEITTAYTPTAVGDYIKLYYDATAGKFHDLERCVGGARAIVSAKQPNVQGATR